VPVVAVSVWPSRAVPEIAGAVWLAGGASVSARAIAPGRKVSLIAVARRSVALVAPLGRTPAMSSSSASTPSVLALLGVRVATAVPARVTDELKKSAAGLRASLSLVEPSVAESPVLFRSPSHASNPRRPATEPEAGVRKPLRAMSAVGRSPARTARKPS
jgi:hypothetical protein